MNTFIVENDLEMKMTLIIKSKTAIQYTVQYSVYTRISWENRKSLNQQYYFKEKNHLIEL